MKTIFLTGLALTAFAANSVLCRLALGGNAIDASGFTIVRLLSGSFALLLIILFAGWKQGTSGNEPVGISQRVSFSSLLRGDWTGSLMLFIYATGFSYAYVTLDTGTGALILFGSVQLTMILASFIAGTRLHISEWIGIFLAFCGFVYLILPGITTPSVTGFALMTLSGIAWGIYTLKGRGSSNPLMDTSRHFLRTIPLVFLLAMVSLDSISYSSEGIFLAILSGAITSGIGYAIWYMALSGLSTIQAAVLQLLVPVIAAFGGVIFVAEIITLRLLFSALMILGGILIVISGGTYMRKSL